MAKGFKTGGRQKGTPNKMSADVKEAILKAFEEVGGSSYLVSVAKEQPAVFCQLVGKVLPLQVEQEISGPDGGPVETSITVQFVKPDAG